MCIEPRRSAVNEGWIKSYGLTNHYVVKPNKMQTPCLDKDTDLGKDY